jgi:hypothetical protein
MPNDTIPPCQCTFLRNRASDPESNIRYDPRLNEYHIVGSHSLTMIYHCPFCGGRAPKSLRPFMFEYLSDTERQRLEHLVSGLDSLESIISKLGPPTMDLDCGKPHANADTNVGEAERDLFYRELRYGALSESADLTVQVRRSGEVQCIISAKPHRQATIIAPESSPRPQASSGDSVQLP